MPVKGEESPPAAEKEKPAPQSLHQGEHSQSTAPTTSTHNEDNGPQASGASAGPAVETVDTEVNPDKPSLPETTKNLPRTKGPMFSSGPEVRERLKFILGASEDNSSDEEPLVAKPPSRAAQLPTCNQKPSPPQASAAVRRSSCIK